MSYIRSFITLFVLFSLFGCGADKPVWREVVEVDTGNTSYKSIKVDRRGNSLVFAENRIIQFDTNGVKRWEKEGLTPASTHFLPNPGAADSLDTHSEIQRVGINDGDIFWLHLDHDGNEIGSAVVLQAEEDDDLYLRKIKVDELNGVIIAAVFNRMPENQMGGLYAIANGEASRLVSLIHAPRDFYFDENSYAVLSDQHAQLFSKQGELINSIAFKNAGRSLDFLDLGEKRFAVSRELDPLVDGARYQVVIVDLGIESIIHNQFLSGDVVTLVESTAAGDFYFLQKKDYEFDPDSVIDSMARQEVTIMDRSGVQIGQFDTYLMDSSRGNLSVLKGYDDSLYVLDFKYTESLQDAVLQRWYLRLWSEINRYDDERNILANYKSGVQSVLIEHKQPSGPWDFPVITPLSVPIVHEEFGVDEQGNIYALGTTFLQQSSFYVEKLAAK